MSTPFNNDHRISFQESMANHGISSPALPIDDGELHRFKIDGDKVNALNGWYVLHGGKISGGAFGCWKRGISQTWCSTNRGSMTDRQQKQYDERMEAARNKRDREQRDRQYEAAAKSGALWLKASENIDPNHPYIIDKDITPIGIRQLDNTLLVPMQNALKELVNLQRITYDGQKRFMYGGAVKSCYKILGDIGEYAFLCEGYATGVTIHKISGHPVIVAFNAGNIINVLYSLSVTHPDLNIIIAADNDHHKEPNTGIEKAWQASAKYGYPFVYPEFEAGDQGTDFNDLANSQGVDAVIKQLTNYRGTSLT